MAGRAGAERARSASTVVLCNGDLSPPSLCRADGCNKAGRGERRDRQSWAAVETQDRSIFLEGGGVGGKGLSSRRIQHRKGARSAEEAGRSGPREQHVQSPDGVFQGQEAPGRREKG